MPPAMSHTRVQHATIKLTCAGGSTMPCQHRSAQSDAFYNCIRLPRKRHCSPYCQLQQYIPLKKRYMTSIAVDVAMRLAQASAKSEQTWGTKPQCSKMIARSLRSAGKESPATSTSLSQAAFALLKSPVRQHVDLCAEQNNSQQKKIQGVTRQADSSRSDLVGLQQKKYRGQVVLNAAR